MPEITLTVHNKVGLHARLAALFVQVAKQFNCDVKVTHGEREGNAKSILSMLALGVNQGAVIIIRAEGGALPIPALLFPSRPHAG